MKLYKYYLMERPQRCAVDGGRDCAGKSGGSGVKHEAI
nr:MAG TPA: Defence against restriction A C-terminal [Caudoviricetes sp.]